MQLFSSNHSTASERVRIALTLKGLDFCETTIVTLGRDQYLALNPSGLVPALRVGGDVIAQSNAILHYLETEYPQIPLLPTNRIKRANVLAFAQHIISEMHAIDVTRVRRYLADEMGQDERDLAKWSAHWFAKGFGVLEETLARRDVQTDFCFGNAPGWADLHLVPHVRKATLRFGIDIGPYPQIAAIFTRCDQLPAFVACRPILKPEKT